MCSCTLVSVRVYVCVCWCVCVSVLLHYILGFSTSCTINNSEGRFACCPRYTFASGLIVIGKPHFPLPLPLSFTFAPPSRPFATHLIVRFVLTAAQLRSCALLNFLSELSFFPFFSLLQFSLSFFFLFYVVIPFNVCAAHLSFLPSFHCPRQGQRRTEGQTDS